jgi:hypothetical protein
MNTWLPGPVNEGAAIPLSLLELAELYASNMSLTEDEIAELSQPLPYLGDLLTLEQFNKLIKEGDLLEERKGLDSRAFAQDQLLQERQQAHDRTLAAVEDLCGPSSAEVVRNLRRAIRDKSSSQYEQALKRLADLTKKTRTFRKRNALLAKLAQAAPNWASAIRSRDGVHAEGKIPGDAEAAWRWRQDQEQLSETYR